MKIESAKVYQAINAVQKELCKVGVAKSRNNTQQGYTFRGIDEIYNALSPLLAANGLCILPRVLSRLCDERVNNSGKPLFYVTVEVEFDFVCAEDGSYHVVKTFGEAMDSGDKATNKAMSAAYKYAAFQAFAIPTEGDNDADSTTHDVKPKISKEEQEKFVADWMAKIDECTTLQEISQAWTNIKLACESVGDRDSYNALGRYKQTIVAKLKAANEQQSIPE